MDYLKDLRTWIAKLEEIGALRRIKGAHWDLEIGTITELIRERPNPPGLLFEQIPGYPPNYRVYVDLRGNFEKQAAYLGIPNPGSYMGFVLAMKERQKSKVQLIPPKIVKEAPCFENVYTGKDINLFKFPTPKWHELDGGRYIGTGDICILRDPDSGYVNLGIYRIMIHDENTLGVYISPGKHGRIILEKYHSKGKNCPVAVTFGHDVKTYEAASFSSPFGSSEYDYAGGLLGEPIEVFEGEYTKLPIPVSAEIVVEGEIPVGEVRPEGPFAEGGGYYAHGKQPEPIIRVKRLLHRNDPIIYGHPHLISEAIYCRDPWPRRDAQIWDEMERAGVPDIRGVWRLGSRWVVISIKQRYPGHAKQALMAAAASHTGAYHNTHFVVVDEDIDPTNVHEVLWAMGNRMSPETDVEIIKRCWSTPLDSMIRKGTPKEACFQSRTLLDACKPYEWIKEFPEDYRLRKELREEAVKKWKDEIIGKNG